MLRVPREKYERRRVRRYSSQSGKMPFNMLQDESASEGYEKLALAYARHVQEEQRSVAEEVVRTLTSYFDPIPLNLSNVMSSVPSYQCCVFVKMKDAY